MELSQCRIAAIALAIALPLQVATGQAASLNRALSQAAWVGEFGRAPAALPTSLGVLLTERELQTVLLLSGRELKGGGLREGDGPGEVRALTGLLTFRGDSALAYGRNGLRFVVMSPGGRPARTISLESLDARDSLRLFMPVGADVTGRVAFVAPRLRAGMRDSSDVVVVDLNGEGYAKVATVWAPLPQGMFGDTPSAERTNLPDADQVVYSSAGSVIVYRSRENALHFRPADGRWRVFPLPARSRPITGRERSALERARDQVKIRNDSVLAQMPPESRARLGTMMAANLAAMVPTRIAAYDRRGLTYLGGATVAIARAQAIPGDEQTYDWVNGSTGAIGSFSLSPKYRILGAGRDEVVIGVVDADGIVQVARLPLRILIQSRNDQRR